MDIRASDADRDAVTSRLSSAFAEGRLDSAELSARTQAALTARSSADLEQLTADLPPPSAPAGPAVPQVRSGRLAIAYKGPVRRSGRWRVPARYTAIVYKGQGLLDLRDAELTSAVTTIRAIAYKSGIQILVPPGVRVELTGLGVSNGEPAALSRAVPGSAVPGSAVPGSAVPGSAVPGSAVPDAARPNGAAPATLAGPSTRGDEIALRTGGGPVVRVRGLAYKGTIEVS